MRKILHAQIKNNSDNLSKFYFSSTCPHTTYIVICNLVPHFLASSGSCAFHTLDGVAAESEGVRFIRLREDAQVGKEILRLQAYPRSTAALKGADASGDHKYFNLTEHNATTLVVSLARSLERLVDRDVPRNLLKFRILCAGKQEKLEEVGTSYGYSANYILNIF